MKNLEEQFLKHVLASGQPVVYACRIEGQSFVPVYVSENLKDRWGYEVSEALGDPGWWAAHLHPDEREEIVAEFLEIFEKGCHTHEYRFMHKDGTYRWVYDRLRLVRDDEGKPIEVVGSWLDITDFKPPISK